MKTCKKHNIEYSQKQCPECKKIARINTKTNKKNGTTIKRNNVIRDENGNITEKFCNECKTYKPIGEFVKKPVKCRQCRSNRRKKNYEENKQDWKDYAERNKKILKEKNKKYREKNKDKLSAKSKEYRKNNKEKILLAGKKSREKNKDAIKKRKKKYAEENKDKISQHSKEYYKKNKTILLAKNKQWRDEKRKNKPVKEKSAIKTKPEYRFMRCVSAAIYRLLKKEHMSSKYAKYTSVELRNYIEDLFSHPDNLTPDGKVWMNWDNHGEYHPHYWDNNNPATWKWQLDHITPQVKLQFKSMDDENFSKCWDLQNLRPYSAKHNNLERDRKETTVKKKRKR